MHITTDTTQKNIVQHISNILFLNGSYVKNLGLMNGKMGVAVFLYNYSRYSKKEIYEDYAGELIDEIYDEITNTTAITLNGLIGIGWGINYLSKNKFVDADLDEALSEIDNSIYRQFIQSPNILNNDNDIFSNGLFYLSRIEGRIKENDNLNILLNKYNVVQLIDEIENTFTYKHYLELNIPGLSTRYLNSILWFLIITHKMNLYPTKTSKLLDQYPQILNYKHEKNGNDWADKVIQYSLTQNLTSVYNNNSFKELAKSLVNEINIIPESDLVNSLPSLSFHKLIYSLDFKGLFFEELNRKIYESLNKKDDWGSIVDKINIQTLGLSGLAGLGMFLLELLNEE